MDTSYILCLYRYAVKESLHSKLKVTQNIQVVIEKSSVEGASDFYAQVLFIFIIFKMYSIIIPHIVL